MHLLIEKEEVKTYAHFAPLSPLIFAGRFAGQPRNGGSYSKKAGKNR
jgi:hypothetical protein